MNAQEEQKVLGSYELLGVLERVVANIVREARSKGNLLQFFLEEIDLERQRARIKQQ